MIPQDCQLTKRPDEIPAWDTFTPDQQKMMARQMEVFAGFTAQVDHEIGRLIDYVRSLPGGENTLIFYEIGDNGGSAEGGLTGTIDDYTFFNGLPADDAYGEAHLAEWGDPTTSPHFAVGWAWAMNTPFQWTKQIASHFGGTRNPLIVSWPKGIASTGEVRSQFHHVIDIAPTILEVAGIPQPTIVNGIAQKPIEGVSMAYTFDDATAPGRRTQQYFEMLVNRGIYDNGWTACSQIGPALADQRPGDRQPLRPLDRALGAVQHRQGFLAGGRPGPAGAGEAEGAAGSALGPVRPLRRAPPAVGQRAAGGRPRAVRPAEPTTPAEPRSPITPG